MDYIYNGLSISLIFEMFRTKNKMDNPFLKEGGSFKVISEDDIKRVLTSIGGELPRPKGRSF